MGSAGAKGPEVRTSVMSSRFGRKATRLHVSDWVSES